MCDTGEPLPTKLVQWLEFGSSTAKMDSGWTDSEVRYLISIWADEEIQALLESAKRNKSIYERIAKGMGKAGFQKTAEQHRDKIKKLKSKCKKIRNARRPITERR